jgi:hypothetical protein
VARPANDLCFADPSHFAAVVRRGKGTLQPMTSVRFSDSFHQKRQPSTDEALQVNQEDPSRRCASIALARIVESELMGQGLREGL